MRTPEFWTQDGWTARLLAPLGAVYAATTARRMARPGWRAPVPVICCGNASVGGAGKTTLALDLGARLMARGRHCAFLTRGYRGGDEASLLAEVAPCFMDADRAAGARSAIAQGADVLVMDDGLQNSSLEKTCSLLVIDGGFGFGNGRVLPAGPLREPVARAAARCRAAVLIGEDVHGAEAALGRLPVLRARLRSEAAGFVGRRVVAFAGIGRPGKFFASLREAGVEVVGARSFDDHHPFTMPELRGLLAEAATADAALVTTPKDAVRLPPDFRESVGVVGVTLVWQDQAAIEALLDEVG